MEQNNQVNDLKETEDLDPEVLFTPVRLPRNREPTSLFGDDPDSNLLKLLETINTRAANFNLDCELPKMDLSALYCIGLTIQEYVRYLGTDIVTEKRAIDKLSPLNTLFTKEEIDDRKITSIVEKYKDTKPINSIPTVPTKLNEKKDLNKLYSYRTHHRFNVTTKEGGSYYDKMLTSSDWRNVLRKKRDSKSAEEAAKIRREKNKLIAQKIASERALKQEEKKLVQKKLLEQKLELDELKSRKRIKQEDQDIFDTSKKKRKITKLKKKKKSVNPF